MAAIAALSGILAREQSWTDGRHPWTGLPELQHGRPAMIA
jgi:hypothetical protein